MTRVASFIRFQCCIVCMSDNNLLIRLSFIGHVFWIRVLLQRVAVLFLNTSPPWEVEGSTPRMCRVKGRASNFNVHLSLLTSAV